MKKAARAMGLGDDWKKAIEKTKDQHAPPGGQPAVIRDLLYEAIDYLRAKDLITVPQVAAESLRMSMMSPQRQLVEPVLHRRRADHRVVPDRHDGRTTRASRACAATPPASRTPPRTTR